ncbi:hypothetical protein GYMLUDRAFT_966072 [Collybiopsis luxurians FD-317 M1]|uniref:Uncharacterized protein n=1 Tax=Collybiopsis luxurians FD-317 M1 TaxID=944289 RepID=A0A0D0CC53_9AGAR|nr:hypothetical protein GYMLUDRAFT_966072 [Collybiopsis luxurians FD-317 M1]
MVLMKNTLVTVCAGFCHGSEAAGRFQLFAPVPGYKPKDGPSSVRSMTSTEPTILKRSCMVPSTSRFLVFSACDCATLGELQLVAPGCTGTKPLVLYVVQRTVAKGGATVSPKTGKATYIRPGILKVFDKPLGGCTVAFFTLCNGGSRSPQRKLHLSDKQGTCNAIHNISVPSCGSCFCSHHQKYDVAP